MDFAGVVQRTTMSSAQNKCCQSKSGALAEAFHDQLAQMMQEGNSSITVKQVEITGTVMSNEPLSMPDMGGLSELTERIGYLLDMMFARNGIPKEPPVEIQYSYTRTEITVTGDREDIDKIQELVNEDGGLKELLRSTLAIASQVINMAESLHFQKEYKDSTDPDAVVDKYAYLFDEERHYHHASFRYGDSLDILSDGKNYPI